MERTLFFFLVCNLLVLVFSQPPPMGGGPMGGGMGGPMGGGMGGSLNGVTSSDSCTVNGDVCANDGSSNYMNTDLKYNTMTGIFTGKITTNGCADNNRWGVFGTEHFGRHTANCVDIEIPLPDYKNGPKAAPLRGAVGFSISGGVNIYGPFEAGFYQGQACDDNLGYCPAGADILTCDAQLHYLCGDKIKSMMLMDSCGGHATPYHYHLDLACDYDHSSFGHSPLIGVALDGHGIYGLYEETGVIPKDLDSCNGHFGPVPARVVNGVTFPAAENVYHYHTSEALPYTIGCYGPVSSMDQCKSLYDTCDSGFEQMEVGKDCVLAYDSDCPCFDKKNTQKLDYSKCDDVKQAIHENVNREDINKNNEEIKTTIPKEGEGMNFMNDNNSSFIYINLLLILISLFLVQ